VPEPTSVVHAPRLDLVLMRPALMRAMLVGDWAVVEGTLGARVPEEWRTASWIWFGARADAMEEDPTTLPWFTRVLLLRSRAQAAATAPTIVGHAGFHGPPDEQGRVELGYTIVTELRRQGFAEEAVRALMAWAANAAGVTRFRASVGPWNAPSLGLVRKLGFVQVGVQWDEEDGEELVFHRDGLPE
jgi:RimJ/RimL family protein N-acetyltransferase